jgi:3',5'-cyclic AMP phosphodiesterase CpdA
MMVTCSRREEADKLSGSRASYCFDLDVNEEPDEAPPENAYSVDAYGCGMPYNLCVSATETNGRMLRTGNWTRFIK